MATTVQEIYTQVCLALCEDGALALGLLTDAQFLHSLAVVMMDFAKRTPIERIIYTQRVVSGTSIYVVPDLVMKPEVCFIGGKLIERTTEADLTRRHASWRNQSDMPKQWHEDSLETKRVELFPIPNYTGAANPIGYSDFYPAGNNLTMVGPVGPSKTVWTLGDTLDGMSDIFAHYIVYGVLEQIFNTDSELRDAQRALYCHARYEEGVSLSEAIALEELFGNEDD
jgi:hypothetical protein